MDDVELQRRLAAIEVRLGEIQTNMLGSDRFRRLEDELREMLDLARTERFGLATSFDTPDPFFNLDRTVTKEMLAMSLTPRTPLSRFSVEYPGKGYLLGEHVDTYFGPQWEMQEDDRIVTLATGYSRNNDIYTGGLGGNPKEYPGAFLFTSSLRDTTNSLVIVGAEPKSPESLGACYIKLKAHESYDDPEGIHRMFTEFFDDSEELQADAEAIYHRLSWTDNTPGVVVAKIDGDSARDRILHILVHYSRISTRNLGNNLGVY
jgi:hypothetical protein